MSWEFSETTREQCEAFIAANANRALSVAEVRDLQNDLGETLASIVLSSVSLQKKAQAKLGDGLWWVTERSLQQATPWQVAELKASWFGSDPAYDLCCGLGGDTLRLARRGTVKAFDRDPEVCKIVTANLANHVGSTLGQDVVCSDVATLELPRDVLIHIDPDRRAESKRTSSPEFYVPSWSTVESMLQRVSGGLAKLAPSAELESSLIQRSHRVWISLAGSVREQSLLVGELQDRFQSFLEQSDALPHSNRRMLRSAIAVARKGDFAVFSGSQDARASTVDKPLALMLDPDAAIRGAELTDAFAEEYGLSLLGGPSGFLTGDAELPSRLKPMAICEPVLWSGSCDDRRLRRELRALNAFPKRIKTRGVQHDPNKMEKKLRECGTEPVTLWIGRIGKKRYATITKYAGI